MGFFFTVLLVVGFAVMGSEAIACYRGINVIMPGPANFSQNMASLGCNNANYCLRAFGKFNGQDGWFSTCASDDTCKEYPKCENVTSGSGAYASSYTSCCCKTDKCNNLDFQGDTFGSATTNVADPSTTNVADPSTTNVAGQSTTGVAGPSTTGATSDSNSSPSGPTMDTSDTTGSSPTISTTTSSATSYSIYSFIISLSFVSFLSTFY